MKFRLIISLLLVSLLLGCTRFKNLFYKDKLFLYQRELGNLLYVEVEEKDYEYYNECYSEDAKFIDRYIKKNFVNCFLSDKIKNLDDIYRKDINRQSVKIEPLFIDSKNCTGLYAMQIYYYKGYSAYYMDFRFIHHLFLIHNDQYIRLQEDMDSLKFKKFLYEDASLSEMYDKPILDFIYHIAKKGTLYNFEPIMLPAMIHHNGDLIFNCMDSCDIDYPDYIYSVYE